MLHLLEKNKDTLQSDVVELLCESGNKVRLYLPVYSVLYQVLHFLEKNKDTLRSDVVELLCESRNKVRLYLPVYSVL